MRYVVTGGSGALGEAVCKLLHDEGHLARSYDLVPPAVAPEAWFRGDICDGLALAEAISDWNADGVIHLASLLVTEASSTPRTAVHVNSIGMATALDVARLLDIERFVWASSAAVFSQYGKETVIATDAPYRPNNVYGGTKILNELLADEYHRQFGLQTVGFRFTLMMGTGKPRGLSGRLSTELIDKPARGEPGRVPYGDDVPNWLWVEDAARAIVSAATGPATATRIFNIAGESRPMRDAVDIVRTLVPTAVLAVEPGVWGLEHRLDTEALERELGFKPVWSLELQLEELLRRAQTRNTSGGAS